MGHLSRRLAATAFSAVAAFFVAAFVSSNANAVTIHTYNFAQYIDSVPYNSGTNDGGGERALTGPFTITSPDIGDGSETLTITAYGSTAGSLTYSGTPTGTNATPGAIGSAYGYFDSGGAGIGVCRGLSGTQCSPSDDDNITGPNVPPNLNSPVEILSLGFSDTETTGLADLLFRAEGHTPDPLTPDYRASHGLDPAHIYIGTGSMDLTSVEFTLYTLGAVDPDGIGATIGLGPYDIAAGEYLHIMFADEQVYLSGLETYPVPVPAALPLFVSGLAGLGFAGWRRKRAKQSV